MSSSIDRVDVEGTPVKHEPSQASEYTSTVFASIDRMVSISIFVESGVPNTNAATMSAAGINLVHDDLEVYSEHVCIVLDVF